LTVGEALLPEEDVLTPLTEWEDFSRSRRRGRPLKKKKAALLREGGSRPRPASKGAFLERKEASRKVRRRRVKRGRGNNQKVLHSVVKDIGPFWGRP